MKFKIIRSATVCGREEDCGHNKLRFSLERFTLWKWKARKGEGGVASLLPHDFLRAQFSSSSRIKSGKVRIPPPIYQRQ